MSFFGGAGNAGGPSPRRSGYGRAGWVDDVHDALEDGDDGRFVDVEPVFEVFLQRGELAVHELTSGHSSISVLIS